MWKLVIYLLLAPNQPAVVETNMHFPTKQACVRATYHMVPRMDLPDHEKAKPRCVKEWVDPSGDPA